MSMYIYKSIIYLLCKRTVNTQNPLVLHLCTKAVICDYFDK